MTARAWASWRSSALLLLLVPGYFPLSHPMTVAGPVGGSLSVQCRYEKEHRTLNKFWCRPPQILRCDKIVETKGSAGKRNGRVSIRDSPANLSFTVTLENLTEEDAGTYWCGVDTPWLRDFHDPIVEVEVSVFPGEPLLFSAPGLPEPRAGHSVPEERSGTGGCEPGGCRDDHSLQPPELHGHLRSSHEAARAHLAQRDQKGQPRTQPTPWLPVQQCPLPAPGPLGAAPAPEHAGCRPLGEQTSEKL
ncbi:CMRF35-like molecule 6 isoform X2 [Homo sapiens]|uniref:CMRF35-like molecule 6 isoform X2 n=1 Tax=Homo sapiens TaxID=9606 RepID=UPI001FB14576|nr:CMRF35-like molecule 6 isoform X2 [Homo sapiens]XP_054170725.1 CMRF35-like molecule 6 isoform X2 [Homo sapiens]XP_054189202.1 CMRF35-like molecule 6 isoform X2 [Homo sapiens]